MTLDRIERTLRYTLAALTTCLTALIILRPGPGLGADITSLVMDTIVH